MIILFGILLIVIGCCMSASAEDDRAYERRQQIRHNEIMEATKRADEMAHKSKVTRRRVLQDKDGNTMAEEIVEETE